VIAEISISLKAYFKEKGRHLLLCAFAFEAASEAARFTRS
jgi:hypothetical protein